MAAGSIGDRCDPASCEGGWVGGGSHRFDNFFRYEASRRQYSARGEGVFRAVVAAVSLRTMCGLGGAHGRGASVTALPVNR